MTKYIPFVFQIITGLKNFLKTSEMSARITLERDHLFWVNYLIKPVEKQKSKIPKNAFLLLNELEKLTEKILCAPRPIAVRAPDVVVERGGAGQRRAALFAD